MSSSISHYYYNINISILLQKPLADSSKDKGGADEDSENKLVLCSAKDKFVLTQDMCVMCGALGTDQEGCLIACVQCGQCYHPYCASVKVTLSTSYSKQIVITDSFGEI